MADTVGETFYLFHGERLSKIIARTGRRQLDGQHMVFGVYLQRRTDLYLLNFSVRMHYRYKLNIYRVSLSFFFSNSMFFFLIFQVLKRPKKMPFQGITLKTMLQKDR